MTPRIVGRRELAHELGVHRALEVLKQRRGELDTKIAHELLQALREPYQQVVAEHARQIRAVASTNDVLGAMSTELERAGLPGASGVLFPMIANQIGRWSDIHSPARYFWREVAEHGYVVDTD
jgi:hypothetical protein